MELTICIELWIGGVFVKNEALQYIGGQNFKFPYVDFGKFNYKDLFGMYCLYGDESFHVDFFYKKPNLSLDEGLVMLKTDEDVSVMYEFYYGSKQITIWCQNNSCVSLQVVDPVDESNDEAYMRCIIDFGCRKRQTSKIVVDERLHSDDLVGNDKQFHYDHLVENEPPLDDDTNEDEQLATKSTEFGTNLSSESGCGESSTESDDVDVEVNTEIDRRKSRMEKKKKEKEPLLESWCTDVEEEDRLLSIVGFDEDDYKHPSYDERLSTKHLQMVVGMIFKDVTQYRQVLADWAIRHGIKITFKKNEKTRVTAVCKNGCDWRLHASVIMGGPLFQVKTMTGKHTCAKAPSNKLATYKYLAKRIENTIKDNPKIAVDKLKMTVLRKCKVKTSKYKVYRAKRAALKNLRGQDGAQYLSLWDYCETVRNFNPDSKLILKRDHSFEQPTFGRMYFCLQAMRLGFINGCRPLIAIDGCFLKTPHGGQLLVAVGKDGNDKLFPIALAVVKVENRENWSWFLSELLEDIGGVAEGKWTFISDRQKGLIEAETTLTL
ncbi:uncharacterized protein [Henckelia pumila]|uniref:uncharacterized protein n=1 Tax=Henckelia pumila TaxID=405737 RepID=UPI003C6E104E